MILQALLVSKDDLSAEMLIRVLSEFGVAVDRSDTAAAALEQLTDAPFDAVIVDFDDPEAVALVIAADCRLRDSDHHPLISIVLLRDTSQIRSILDAGAQFILTRPISEEQAQNTFRAATALLRHERRQSSRLAVQAAVSIRIPAGNTNTDNTNTHTNTKDQSDMVEGILLDLAKDDMDVLAAKPLPSDALVHLSFELPDGGAGIEADATVAWTSANGEAGLRLLAMDEKTQSELTEWLAARSHQSTPEEPDAVSPGKLTDLSLGGCYVQTDSPFPQSSTVDLCLRAAGMEIRVEGLVRVMHPGHGMGVEFPARTEEQRNKVGKFIDFLTSQPDAAPQLETYPRSLLASPVEPGASGGTETDAEDPLLQLLRGGTTLEEEQFLAELHRQRTAAVLSQ